MKIDITEVTKLKLEAIQKTMQLQDIESAIKMALTAYVRSLQEEEAKKLIEAL